MSVGGEKQRLLCLSFSVSLRRVVVEELELCPTSAMRRVVLAFMVEIGGGGLEHTNPLACLFASPFLEPDAVGSLVSMEMPSLAPPVS